MAKLNHARNQDRARTRRQAADRWRGSACERGYNRRWRTEAAAFRRRYPLCQLCLVAGRTQPSEVVDHRIPHRGDPILFWDAANWQALCKRCHDRKTITTDMRRPKP